MFKEDSVLWSSWTDLRWGTFYSESFAFPLPIIDTLSLCISTPWGMWQAWLVSVESTSVVKEDCFLSSVHCTNEEMEVVVWNSSVTDIKCHNPEVFADLR